MEVLISCAVTAHLICTLICFHICKMQFSHDMAHFYSHCFAFGLCSPYLSGRAVTNVGRTCGPTLLLVYLYAKAIKYV